MTAEAAEPRSLLRRLYDWCLAAAHRPHALWTMGAISFAESSFFPVPPDVMLLPMALARPDRAWRFAARILDNLPPQPSRNVSVALRPERPI